MKIVFWSGTGNTEKMASVIADGIVKGGKEAELINVSEASTTCNFTPSTSNTSPSFLSINQPIIVLINCGKLGIGIQ